MYKSTKVISKMIFFLMTVALTFAKETNINGYPNCTVDHNVTYEYELIVSNMAAPYHLALDYDMNTLFFSYSGNGSIINNKLIIFEMAYLHLDSKRMVTLKEVKGGFAAAVDNKNKVIYLGGDDGVYIFDWTKNKARSLKVINDSIWQMFYNDGLYITTYPKGKTYWYKEKYIAQLLDSTMVNMIAVDENGNIIFCNKTGLYGYHAGVKVNKLGYYEVTGFSKDMKNKLYFSTSTSIYYVGIEVQHIVQISTVEKEANGNGITGLAVERNGNFIFSTDNSIMRIKRTNNNCTNTTVKGKNKKAVSKIPFKIKSKLKSN